MTEGNANPSGQAPGEPWRGSGLGATAGFALTTGSGNIYIGNSGANSESNTIRIGDNRFQTATFIAGISGKTAAGGVPAPGPW